LVRILNPSQVLTSLAVEWGFGFQDLTFAKERGQSHLDQSNLILPALAVLPTRRTGMIHSTFQIPHHVDLARPSRAETGFVLVELGNAIQYGARSIGTWSVRTHCIQPITTHTEISKRSDWLMSTDPVPILMAPYCMWRQKKQVWLSHHFHLFPL
jgi:hypothetical protein